MSIQFFESLEAFYAADERRRRSGEADYGVQWMDTQAWPRWRVSYIQATGEVYAVELGGQGRVEVLGVVPPDPEDKARGHQTYYRTLDLILGGWLEQYGRPGGLQWVRYTLGRQGG